MFSSQTNLSCHGSLHLFQIMLDRARSPSSETTNRYSCPVPRALRLKYPCAATRRFNNLYGSRQLHANQRLSWGRAVGLGDSDGGVLVARANNIQSFRCKALPLWPRKRPQRPISRTFYATVRWLWRLGPWLGADAVPRRRVERSSSSPSAHLLPLG